MEETMTEIVLETKLVGEIEGRFYVPSYQRGYRWEEKQVTRLLDDIYTNKNPVYCLQPVVVRNEGDRYELIDGQQRLTTLYLIYRYMNSVSNGFIDEPKFSLEYETRKGSAAFLKNIDIDQKDKNIDFWFMCNAYEAIGRWFEEKGKKSTLTTINTFFDENVKIIWYEVDETQDPISLFTRLNIGKIELTSAELVKAMFLSRKESENGPKNRIAELEREKQEEISLQWDNIEKELHDEKFWYFLTNRTGRRYTTKIDLILDLMSGKPETERDKYYTYFWFEKLREESDLNSIWQTIQNTFLILKDWYNNHELYHKIGYLITSGANTLSEIFEVSKNRTKKQFKSELDKLISKSIELRNETNYADLSYEKPNEAKRISRLLLLFNVESVRRNGEQSQWFPFDKFKYSRGSKVNWSLEHIHAQNSDLLRTQEDWKEWLRLHIQSIKAVLDNDDGLIEEMENAIAKQPLREEEFTAISARVIELLSSAGNTEYLHSISNLALLDTGDNAALSNSTFDVKRNEIIRMDREDKYIPFCTKMVFLKYYTPSEDNQLHFWGQPDREAYIKAMNDVLKNYLQAEIKLLEGNEG